MPGCSYKFVTRQNDTVVLKIKGQRVEVQVLHTLAYTQMRKRMSVICRVQGRVVLFMKVRCSRAPGRAWLGAVEPQAATHTAPALAVLLRLLRAPTTCCTLGCDRLRRRRRPTSARRRCRC